MTTEIELLPLPEGYDTYSPPRLYDGQMFHAGQMRAYARANSARAIAPLQAEIEALRETLATLKAENEKLREALRELVDVFSESGMYDEEVFAKARAAALEEAARACEELDEEASCKEGRPASGHECAAVIRAMKEQA